jgi:hypothetical protein
MTSRFQQTGIAHRPWSADASSLDGALDRTTRSIVTTLQRHRELIDPRDVIVVNRTRVFRAPSPSALATRVRR